MENKGFKIVDSKSNLDLIIQDYSEATTSFTLKNFKIGVLGTALLCSSPAIYAKESVYNIKKEINNTSVNEVYDCGALIDNFIESVNELQKITFTKKEIIEHILSFKSLINNWDGYGAIPVEIKSAGNAIVIINLLSDKAIGLIDDFYPNTNGTISFEWVNDFSEKVYLEIGNETFSYFVKYNSLEPLFFDNLEITNENVEILSEYIRSI